MFHYKKSPFSMPVWLGLLLFLVSCTKTGTETLSPAEDAAVVQTWRYPCGPSCDAMAWVLQMEDGTAFEAPNLPADFQVDERPVRVQYQKTGQTSSPTTGTGLEIISVLKISAR